ncbi:MAG TPA: elongation factor P [bacterium]|nr:elongation factor P [bacterium]
MPLASELRAGNVIRLEGHTYRVVEVDAHFGGGRMGSLVKLKLEDVETGTHTERRFRPEDKTEAVELERKQLNYLYREEDVLFFMDPTTYEQYEISAKLLGRYLGFVKDGEGLAVEFLGARPVRVLTPRWVELVIATTGPAQHSQELSVWKEAVLENGMNVQVPLFIATGDKITIDLETGKYHDRVK